MHTLFPKKLLLLVLCCYGLTRPHASSAQYHPSRKWGRATDFSLGEGDGFRLGDNNGGEGEASSLPVLVISYRANSLSLPMGNFTQTHNGEGRKNPNPYSSPTIVMGVYFWFTIKGMCHPVNAPLPTPTAVRRSVADVTI